MEIPGRESEQTNKPAGADSCPLNHREQTRNLVLFGVNTGLFYLAAPVLLVGNLQAAVCEKLHASDTVANLPSSMYLVMASLPVFVAWLFPRAALLKRVLVISYTALAGVGTVVVAALLLPIPDDAKIAAVIVQGAVTGGALTVATMFLFEVLGRGVAPSRRGAALGLGYGAGPFLALASSLAVHLLLTAKVGPVAITEIPFPWNAAAVFGASVPIMGLAAILSTRFVIPLPADEVAVRKPFFPAVFGGLGDFLAGRVLLITTIAAILVFAGYQIGPNMTLYTKVVLGKPPDQYVGEQLALRFGFKGVFGLFYGWLLTRTNPKAGVLVPALMGLSGVAWALFASPEWFLMGFGLVGAGELFGVYVTNYILCCSTPAKTRRNMGFASLMMFPAAPAGAIYGRISDSFKASSPGLGFRLSFIVAASLIAIASGH